MKITSGLSKASGIHQLEAYNKQQEVQNADFLGECNPQLPQFVNRDTFTKPLKKQIQNVSPMNMKEKASDSEQRLADKVEIAIHLDSELVEQIRHLTNDPSKVIEVAIRQWLRGETPRDDELTRTPQRKPLPPRGEWND